MFLASYNIEGIELYMVPIYWPWHQYRILNQSFRIHPPSYHERIPVSFSSAHWLLPFDTSLRRFFYTTALFFQWGRYTLVNPSNTLTSTFACIRRTPSFSISDSPHARYSLRQQAPSLAFLFIPHNLYLSIFTITTSPFPKKHVYFNTANIILISRLCSRGAAAHRTKSRLLVPHAASDRTRTFITASLRPCRRLQPRLCSIHWIT